MRRLRIWFKSAGDLLRRASRERSTANEIDANIQLHVDDNIRAGMDPSEARRVALAKFGSIDAAIEGCRDVRGFNMVDGIRRDVGHAFRLLIQNKAWALVAVLSLALGIGVNTALFTFVSGLLLEKLPVESPDELVAFRWIGENGVSAGNRIYGYWAPDAPTAGFGTSFSYAAFREFQKANQTLADLFAFAPAPTLNVIFGDTAEIATGQFVSGNYHTALGLSAVRGRTLLPSDEAAGAEPAAVISYEYWERRFGKDPAVLNRNVAINKALFRIVGVMAPGLPNPLMVGLAVGPDVTIPLAREDLFPDRRSEIRQPWLWWLAVMGRLKEGGTPEQVVSNLQPVFEATALDGRAAYMTTLQPGETGGGNGIVPRLRLTYGGRGVYDLPPAIAGALAIVGVISATVLLIVCVNLANLFFAKTAARQREIAVRSAIGASRVRIIRQLLTETVVLATIGGVLSLAVIPWYRRILPASVPVALSDIDRYAVAFAAALTVVTGIMFGLIPALRATRQIDREGMSRKFRSDWRRRTSVSRTLVVAQVAMSLLLLIGAGLFLRTLVNLRGVSAGFNPNDIALITIDRRAGQADDARATTAYRQILAEFGATPGVRSATFSSFALLSGLGRTTMISVGPADGAPTRVNTMIVHENFFETMEIPLRMGRMFNDRDVAESTAVAVVNEAFVRAFLPASGPLGSRLGDIEIVGVVADSKYARLREEAVPLLYRPYRQAPLGSGITFQVRTSGDPEEFLSLVREIVKRVDPNLPIMRVSTQMAAIEESALHERVLANTSVVLGVLALAIAMIGLYGIMLYTVTQRTREIGIRIALGAEKGMIVRSVISETLRLVGIGAAIGLGAALAITPLVTSVLFNVAPHDPTVIAVAVGIMFVVASVAAYLPARRASRVDPLGALRYE